MFKRINESSPILARFLVFIFVPVTVAAVAGYVYMNKSLPQEGGSLPLAGIAANVNIARNGDAVPHITAASDEDAYFALGYVHAQDRLWQMEYQKLIGQGRLSEVHGAATLKIDFYVRTLGLRQAAEQALTQLSPQARQLLDAYVKGVNARIGEGKPLSAEYYVNDRRPEAWTAADSLLQLKLLQIGLNDSSVDSLRQVALVRQLGMAKAAALVHAEDNEQIAVGDDFSGPAADLVQELSATAARLKSEFGIGDGDLASRAWVVDGKLTRSGKPILANDLHSVAQIPAKWYMAEIQGKQIHVAGATIPGLPLIFSGRNDQISWGTSALRNRAPMLTQEKINPLDDNKYAAEGGWKSIDSRIELVQVKSAFPSYLRGEIKPVKKLIRSTERGPLISDLAESSGASYSIELVGLSPQDKSFDGLLALNFAQNWGQVKAGLRNYASPAMNLVYADQEGNIASKIVGKLAYGSQVQGVSLPAQAASAKAERYVPFDALPESLNPAGGIILRDNATAYSPAAQASTESSRAARIGRLLTDQSSAAGKVDIQKMLNIQGDDLSLGAAAVLKQMLTVKPRDARQEKALAYLRAWDYRAAPNSVAASIYDTWVDHLFDTLVRENTANAGSSRRILDSYPAEAKGRFITAVLRDKQAEWCSTKAAPKNCDAQMAQSLQASLDELQLSVGKDMADWKLGAIQKVAYRHPGIDGESFFASFFNRRGPSQGGNFSVNGGAPAVFSKDGGYQRTAGSSYRQVIDLSPENKSTFITSTGQSGNILSANYDSFIVAAGTSALSNVGFGEKLLGARVLTLTTLTGKPE